jgi:hypothetical protein
LTCLPRLDQYFRSFVISNGAPKIELHQLPDRRPYGCNRQKRCPKSSATSIGLRSRTLATIARRISHSHPALTVAEATRIEHHCGTCGDRDATDFFCSALRAHMSRPIPHPSSQFSRPPFFCHSFSRALLRANSCVPQLRVFCFPGSSLNPMGPSHKAAARFGSRSHSLLCAPRKWGKKKEKIQLCLTSVTIVGFVGADPRATPVAEQRSEIHRPFRRHAALLEERR